MIRRMVEKTIELMINERLIEYGKKDDYIYTLTCIVENVITFTSLILLGLLFDNAVCTMGFLVFFFILRKRTGGYHVKTFIGCYVWTMLIYICIVSFCIMLSNNILLFSLFSSAAIIFVIGGVNHPNIKMNEKEFKNTKKAARTILLFELIIIIFLRWINADEKLITYLSVSIILCCILLCIAKLLKQEVSLDGKKK